MRPTVSVCIPSHVMVHANFAMSFAGMVGSTPNAGFYLTNMKFGYVAEARIQGARRALEVGADYVLFLDSDMSFPPNTLVRLLAADKDIVGVNYIQRAPPYKSLAVPFEEDQIVQGVVKVKRLPLGVSLIKTSVFRAVDEPWFQQLWNGKDFDSEDYRFIEKAQAEGFEAWMDTELSLEVVHWGELGYIWTGDGHRTVAGI